MKRTLAFLTFIFALTLARGADPYFPGAWFATKQPVRKQAGGMQVVFYEDLSLSFNIFLGGDAIDSVTGAYVETPRFFTFTVTDSNGSVWKGKLNRATGQLNGTFHSATGLTVGKFLCAKTESASERPNVLVLGDSRSNDAAGSNWVNYVRTNAAWNNRAEFQNFSRDGKFLRETVNNAQEEIVSRRPAMAGRDVAIVWMGVNDRPTFTEAEVQADFVTLWTCLATNGFRIIQIGFGPSGGGGISASMEDFIATNATRYGYSYVIGTNFEATVDGVHPTYPGAQTIGDRVQPVLTKMLSRRSG